MAKSNKRKKAATKKKIKVREPAADAPIRFIILTTDGINQYIPQRTMSVPEALNALESAYRVLQNFQQQTAQAAQQQAAQQQQNAAEQGTPKEPVPDEPAPPAEAPIEEAAETPGEPAEVGEPVKPN